MEIIRNGLCASMPGKKWVQGKGEIALELCRHPLLDGGRALTVLDHGHGFNARSKELISSLGRTMGEKEGNPDGDFDGASQKGIGRFAAFGCMKRNSKKLDTSKGFYILTRDKYGGPITLISMVPSLIEERRGTPIEELPLDDKRLGDTASIEGTFSMVIIPDPVFVDSDEIIEGIRFRLPRKLNQMFKLTINGEQVKPPPLEGRVHFVSGDGEIEVHADVEPDPDSSTGMWFTDEVTGFRVALASHLGRAFVPPPYCFNGLSGDIFVKGLLKEQTASRGGLNGDYLRNDAWTRVKASLFANRSSVSALLGDRRSHESQGEKEMADLISLAVSAFGASQVALDEFGSYSSKPQSKEGGEQREGSERSRDRSDIPKKKREPRDNPSGKVAQNKGKRELRAIRLGDHDFIIDTQRLDPYRYAQSDSIRMGDEPVTIYVNDQYEGLPTRAEARSEHVINSFLFAAACADAECANHAQTAMDQVIKWRAKLFAGK